MSGISKTERTIKMPKVSVLIANYNYGRYLHKRIQTILNQTYQDLIVTKCWQSL